MLATRPLFAAALAFMAGIAAASTGAGSLWVWLVACAAAGIAGVAAVIIGGRGAVAGALIAVAAAGALRYCGAVRPAQTDISQFAPAAHVRLQGFICSDPDVRPGRASFYLSVTRLWAAGQFRRASGEAWCSANLSRTDASFDFHYGDRVEALGALERPAGVANPGMDSWADYLARRGVWAQCRIRLPSMITRLSGGQSDKLRYAAFRARSALLSSLRRSLPRADAAVLAGVLLGLRTDLPPGLLAAFSATGTIHALATAGLHVGILYGIVLNGLGLFFAPRKTAAAATIGVLWFYDLMAGGRIAVTRAAIMATVYLLAIVLERTPEALNSLGAAALIVLVASPAQLFDMGFEASFAAVLMIALTMPAWDRMWAPALKRIESTRWRRLARTAMDLIGLTLFAQAGAWPVIARTFSVVALLGSAANLLIVPALCYLIPAGLAIGIAGIWLPAAAAFLAHWLLSPVIRAIVAGVVGAAGLPGASTTIASPSLVAIGIYYGLAGFVFLRAERWIWRLRTELAGAEASP